MDNTEQNTVNQTEDLNEQKQIRRGKTENAPRGRQ